MKEQLIAWMAGTKIAAFMALPWTWPWFETFHFIGMSLLFGSLLVMDLRVMGFLRRHVSLHGVHSLTPWGLTGFLINLITGLGFVFKDANRYFENPDFLFKMVCILLAGINFLVFWFFIRQQLDKLPDDGETSLPAKAVGATSIILWTLVIWGGRLIPVYGVG